MDELLRQVIGVYVVEVQEQVQGISTALLQSESEPRALPLHMEELFRQAHNLKGSSASLGIGELEQLAQRVIARYHLGPLDEAETAHYVQHRLGVAGGSGATPFDKAALRRIHQLSRGVPRRINLLCDRALLGAYARNQAQVTRAVVRQAAAEVFDTGEAGAGRGAPWVLASLLLVAAGGVGAVLWMGGRATVVSSAAPSASASASASARPR